MSRPNDSTQEARRPRLSTSVLFTLIGLVAVPAAVAAAWVVGAGTRAVGHGVWALRVSWVQVGYGAATLAGAAVAVGVVHALRVARHNRRVQASLLEEVRP